MVEALREISVPVSTPASEKPANTEKTSPSEASAEQQSQTKEPLSTIPSLTSVVDVGPDVAPAQPESRSESRASTNASEDFSPPSSSSRQGGSETGMETEEDEGMVLVGRPGQ